MADLTSQTTFRHHVWGNNRVVICEVSGTGTSTNDIVIVPLSFVETAFGGSFRTSAFSSAVVSVNAVGTTVGIFQIAATTGISYTFTAVGR